MRKAFPRTVLEFEHWFHTEEACRKHLFRLRWPQGFSCPRCEGRQAWPVRRGLWRCGTCGKDISLLAGTAFEGSKLSLRIWFRAIWWVTNQKSGISALGLQRTLGLGSYETAWLMLHKLRRAMIRPDREKLSGKVEVDETLLGGHKPDRRGHVGRSIVVIAVESKGKKMGRIRLKRVRHPSRESLQGFVRDNVAAGSVILTDGAWGYDGLGTAFDHRSTVLDGQPKNAAIRVLPKVHRVSALIKRWWLGTHQGSLSHGKLDHYLDEFAFRFNRRASPHRGQLFHRLLQGVVSVQPTTLGDVIKGAK
jgi:hypothetical protein